MPVALSLTVVARGGGPAPFVAAFMACISFCALFSWLFGAAFCVIILKHGPTRTGLSTIIGADGGVTTRDTRLFINAAIEPFGWMFFVVALLVTTAAHGGAACAMKQQ